MIHRFVIRYLTIPLTLTVLACTGNVALEPKNSQPEIDHTESKSTPDSAASGAGGSVIDSFVVSTAQSRISGEVHSVAGSTPEIVLIVVGGSSARTRADTAAAIPLFLDANTAIAVHDRRGNGDSQGRFEAPTTENTAWLVPALAGDISAVVQYLITAGYSRVGLLGSSMGSWVNIATAAMNPNVDSIICLGGTASSVGVSDDFSDHIASGLPIPQAVDAARSYSGTPGYDPASDLAAMTQPGLWIMGAEDDSNPTQLDAEVLARLRQQGKAFEVLILPDTNHEMINIRTREFNSSWIDRAKQFATNR